jgi:hypothetical protein
MFEKRMAEYLRSKGFDVFKRQEQPCQRPTEDPISLSSVVSGFAGGGFAGIVLSIIGGPSGMRRLYDMTMEVLTETLHQAGDAPPARGRPRPNVTVVFDGSPCMRKAIEDVVGQRAVAVDTFKLGFIVDREEIKAVCQRLKAKGWDYGRTMSIDELQDRANDKLRKRSAQRIRVLTDAAAELLVLSAGGSPSWRGLFKVDGDISDKHQDFKAAWNRLFELVDDAGAFRGVMVNVKEVDIKAGD